MSENEPDEVSLETKLLLLKLSIDKMEAEIEPAKAEELAIVFEQRKMRDDYERRMRELDTQHKGITERMFDAKRALTLARAEAESVARQAEQIKRAKKLTEDYLVLEKQWDNITIAAPWREWAKDHQIEAGQKITYFQKMILADTMGLGKTLASIIALDLIEAATREASVEWPYAAEYAERWDYAANANVNVLKSGVTKPCGKKVLYFCPATMIGNVDREIRRWAPHRNIVILGGQTKILRRALLTAMQRFNEYVVICNYEAWRKDRALLDELVDVEFDTCIIDEAHNIKDRDSVGYKGIKKIVSESDIPFVIPMTGTPILNRPQELFTLLTLVDPDKFYSENQYLRDYCEQDYFTTKWRFKPGGLDRLAKQISNRYLRRTKEQAGIVLPERTIIEHEIVIDPDQYPEQARARNEMNKWGSIMLDPSNEDSKALTTMAQIAVYTRLRQIEVWPAGIEQKIIDPWTLEDTGEVIKIDIEQSQKMDYIINYNRSEDEWEGLIPEITADERVIVFSQFTKPLMELRRRCEAAGYRVAILTGDTKDDERQIIIQDFDVYYTPDRDNSKFDILLAHYRVGGVGANYTAATQMIILDEEWNAGKRDQAYDRIHRIGQTKPTTIHVLRDKDTIDDWLNGLIQAKEAMVEGFHDTTDILALELWKKLKGDS
jgi:SNF2 family DNA or RNA helicase